MTKHIDIDLEAALEGYLDTVAFTDQSMWEEDDREWSGEFAPTSLRKSLRDLRAFITDNAEDLHEYVTLRRLSGRGAADAIGGDFWLSRNGHGSGFFDRGSDPVFQRLQKSAKAYGTVDSYLNRRGNAVLD